MEINLAALEWIADYLLTFGNNATVLEPAELIGLIQQKYTNYISIIAYQNNGKRIGFRGYGWDSVKYDVNSKIFQDLVTIAI